ncbi:MAG: HAMP domain-containing sensor histidine kinase [Kineosporiaceae bacterium]
MAATLQREDELRRAMAADVAHELRTPVTILRGVSEEVLDGLAEPGLDMVRSFHEEVLRLERIVDDLATLSSAEAAGLSLRRDRVDLAGVAEQAVGQLRHRFQEAGQDVEVILTGPRELLAVDGDEIRLGQVVTNLLTNATAVTPRGGRIEVAVAREAGEVRLTVTDSGPGIPPEERERVFERFFRGRGAGDRPGSGIGLAVVAELVRVHGGQVRAGGPPGRGAVFTVTLPAG